VGFFASDSVRLHFFRSLECFVSHFFSLQSENENPLIFALSEYERCTLVASPHPEFHTWEVGVGGGRECAAATAKFSFVFFVIKSINILYSVVYVVSFMHMNFRATPSKGPPSLSCMGGGGKGSPVQ
jgi:hypothetical protein